MYNKVEALLGETIKKAEQALKEEDLEVFDICVRSITRMYEALYHYRWNWSGGYRYEDFTTWPPIVTFDKTTDKTDNTGGK